MTMGELTLTYIEGVTWEWGCMLLKGLMLRLMLAKYESSTLNNKKKNYAHLWKLKHCANTDVDRCRRQQLGDNISSPGT